MISSINASVRCAGSRISARMLRAVAARFEPTQRVTAPSAPVRSITQVVSCRTPENGPSDTRGMMP